MVDPVPASVLRTCSQLRPIASEILARIEAEVAAVEVPWSENYGAYQSGGWKTVALYNSDGCSQTNDLEDGAPRPTEVAMKLPAVRELIDGSGLALMWARFLLLEPGAYLWEHTDYGAVPPLCARRDHHLRPAHRALRAQRSSRAGGPLA